MGLRPQALTAFGLNPPSQLVIGYLLLVSVSESGSLRYANLETNYFMFQVSQGKLFQVFALVSEQSDQKKKHLNVEKCRKKLAPQKREKICVFLISF